VQSIWDISKESVTSGLTHCGRELHLKLKI
jgi:hypothetical protein